MGWVRKGVKPLNEHSEDIEIAFAGVLFDLLVLACEEEVDLETSMQRGIAMLEQRLERPAAGS